MPKPELGTRTRGAARPPPSLLPYAGRGARPPSAPCLRMENDERSVLGDPLHIHRPPLPERCPRCAHPPRAAPPGCGFPTSSGKGRGVNTSDGAPTAAGGAEAPAHPTPSQHSPSQPSRLPGPQLLPPPAARAGAAQPQSFCSYRRASVLSPRKHGRFSPLCSLNDYGTRRERANVLGKALGVLGGVSLKPGVFSLFPGLLAVSSCVIPIVHLSKYCIVWFRFVFSGGRRGR